MGVAGRLTGVLRAALERDVFRNAVSLWGATVVTSGLGFVFWLIAARTYPVASVGIASASVSAMQLLAEFGMLGMGSLIIAELASDRFPVGLVSAGTLIATIASIGLGIGYVLMQHVFSTKLGPMGHGVVGPALFVAGVGVNGFVAVLDMATIGINRGGLQLWRNTVFSIAKLVLLVTAGVVGVAARSELIYGAWFGGNLLSLVSFWFHVRRIGVRPQLRPALRTVVAARRDAFAHHWLNLAAAGPALIFPLLVAATLSSKLTAAYFVISMIVGFASIIAAHLSTALFALPRGDLDRLADELRATLRVAFGVGILSAIGFAALGHLFLEIFGRDYASEWTTMAVLGLASIPFTVKVHYSSVERVRGHLMRCAAVSTAGAAFEIALAYLGARSFGLIGVAGGQVVALCLEAVVLWTPVARAARVPIIGNPAWLWRADRVTVEGIVASIAPADPSPASSGADTDASVH